MSATGKVYVSEESEFALWETNIVGDYLMCDVRVNGQTLFEFPISKDYDNAEITLRIANIINQSEALTSPVRVEMDAV